MKMIIRPFLEQFGKLSQVETVGIEPTSAVACGAASTSVAGALFLTSRSPTPAGFRSASPGFVSPPLPGRSGRASPFLMPAIHPTGRGWANTHGLAID